MSFLTLSRISPRIRRAASWFGLAIGVGIIISGLLMYAFWIRHRDQPEVVGVSFSQHQSEQYGVDWHDNYLALLDDLKVKHLRLAAYWDRVEPAPDRFDWSETDWMLDEAAKRGAQVKLVIGQKLIRVPECFYPSWLNRNNPDLVAERVQKLVSAVAVRYKNHPALEGWQLENEFLLRSFGDCPRGNFSQSKLRDEIAALKQADNSHSITLTQSDQAGWPITGPVTDYYGFSMYRTVWNPTLGYFNYPQRGIYNWWKAAVIETFRPTNVVIHELQAEAWGPTGNQYLSFDEASKSMNPVKLADNIAYARETHIKRFDLWGSEWWYWLKTKQNHPEMWEASRLYLTRTN